MHIYSQEFKARNYSDDGAAYYVKLRLGVSESDMGKLGLEDWRVRTIGDAERERFRDENEAKRDMKCYETLPSSYVCECEAFFSEARSHTSKTEVNGKAYGR